MPGPREAFGGDDEGGGEEAEVKKLDLSRFGLGPDTNIRDVFWEIMASYATSGKSGIDLSRLNAERFTLMRIALSVLARRQSQSYGLSQRAVIVYTFMMIFDAGWEDVLVEFLERTFSIDARAVRHALRYALSQKKYREVLSERFTKMLRDVETVETAISILADIGDDRLARAMKKELTIIARGDIGENQLNAIKLLALIRKEEGVKKSLIALLSHWDEEARLAAAQALVGMKDNAVKKAAEERLKKESSNEVIKILKRLIK